MNVFFIGQRVRVVRGKGWRSDNQYSGELPSIGVEATVVGTNACPNAGFQPGPDRYSIRPDGFVPATGYAYDCGMVYGWQLEPIVPLSVPEVSEEEISCPN